MGMGCWCCKPFLWPPKSSASSSSSSSSSWSTSISPRVVPFPPPLPLLSTKPRSSVNAASPISPAEDLRRLLDSPGLHQGPACFDALSAKLIQRAGFAYCFTSGFSLSAARLALPDVGLISYGEMLDQGSLITQAVSIPVIGDGDNGYGNAMNVKRTVQGFINAGFAGIILEDQVAPKACGHTQGRKVVSREEALMKIKAAIDARKESGSDIVIVARTDSRQAISLDEALWRSRAFADAGADVLFIDALASREEMKAFCDVSPLVPKMANMLEGGGKTPILNPAELEELGFKLVSYPLSLIGVSMRAMEDALAAIKGGRLPPPGSLPSFDEIKETLGFNKYYEEEKRYMVNNSQPSDVTGETRFWMQRAFGSEHVPVSLHPDPIPSAGNSSPTYSARISQGGSDPIIDLLPPVVSENMNTNRSQDRLSWIWSRTLRLKITGKDGLQKLDVRIPAGFLEGVSWIIPGLAGVNLLEMLEDAPMDADGSPQSGKILLDFDNAAGDRIQVLVE